MIRYFLAVALLFVLTWYTAETADTQYCSDCLRHVIPRPKCVWYVRARTRNCNWLQYSTSADQVIHNGEIPVYRIRWFNGRWSNYFVTGYNDLDHKVNRHKTFYCSGRPIYYNSVRRLWSYFYDHTHQFLYCGNLRTIQALAAEKGTKLLSDFDPSKDEITDQDIEDLDNDNKETTLDDDSKMSPSQDNEETKEMTQEDILEN